MRIYRPDVATLNPADVARTPPCSKPVICGIPKPWENERMPEIRIDEYIHINSEPASWNEYDSGVTAIRQATI